jgi:hypothetical protein
MTVGTVRSGSQVDPLRNVRWQNADTVEAALLSIQQNPSNENIEGQAKGLEATLHANGVRDTSWVKNFLYNYKKAVFDQDPQAKGWFKSGAAEAARQGGIPSTGWADNLLSRGSRQKAEKRYARTADVFEADQSYRALEAQRAAATEHKKNEALFGPARAALGQLERLDQQMKKHNGITSNEYLGPAAEIALRSLEPLRAALARPDSDPGKYEAVWDAYYGRGGGPDHGRLFGQPGEKSGVGPESGSALARLRAFAPGSDPAAQVENARTGTIADLKKAGDWASRIPTPLGQALAFGLRTAAGGLEYAGNDINGSQFLAQTGLNLADTAMRGKGSFVMKQLKKQLQETARQHGPLAAAVLGDASLSPQQKAEKLKSMMPELLTPAFVDTVKNALNHVPPEQRNAAAQELLEFAHAVGITEGVEQLKAWL